MTQPNPQTGRMTGAQVEMLMRQAGFPDSELRTGLGVALAESGYNPNAFNGTGRDESYGLFQINMKGDLGPDRRKKFGISNNKQLFDPATNIKAAYIVWKESGWKAWTTYTSGKYNDGIIPRVEDKVSDVKEGVSNLNPINGVTDAVNNFGKNLIKTGTNLAGFGIGIALLILGFVLLIRQSPTVKKAVTTAATVIPAGKAGKIVKGVVK